MFFGNVQGYFEVEVELFIWYNFRVDPQGLSSLSDGLSCPSMMAPQGVVIYQIRDTFDTKF